MSDDDQLRCAWCDEPFRRPHDRGPVPKYCSDAHRQAAHRARSRGLDTSSLFAGLKTTNVLADLDTSDLFAGLKTTNVLADLDTSSLFAGLKATNVMAGLDTSDLFAKLVTSDLFAGLKVTNVLAGLDLGSLFAGLDIGSLFAGLDTSDLFAGLRAHGLLADLHECATREAEASAVPHDDAAIGVLVLALVLVVVRLQVLSLVAAKGEECIQVLWLLWTLHWSVQNSSPAGGLAVTVADVALLHLCRRGYKALTGDSDGRSTP
ncbi:MAG TPA: hypothetical protein VK611_26320 [Acidimicrobiales bacterium]|nr:hypothetical protein [Acidimicrobiales bacterium]